MNRRITINGREYSTPDEMPADVRAIYDRLMVDRDGNGVPDVVDQARRQGMTDSSGVATHHEVVINNKTYDRLEDVPPDLRKVVERAFGQPGATPARPVTGPAVDPGHRSIAPLLLLAAAAGAGVMLLVWWLVSGG